MVTASGCLHLAEARGAGPAVKPRRRRRAQLSDRFEGARRARRSMATCPRRCSRLALPTTGLLLSNQGRGRAGACDPHVMLVRFPRSHRTARHIPVWSLDSAATT